MVSSTTSRERSARVWLAGFALFVAGLGTGWLARPAALPPALVLAPVPKQLIEVPADSPLAPAAEEIDRRPTPAAPTVSVYDHALASLQDLVDELEGRLAEPRKLTHALVSQLSDRQLQGALAAIAGLRSDDLEDIRDLRRFSERLVDVAIEGVLVDEESLPQERVLFSAEPAAEDPEEVASTRFDRGRSKIYAYYHVEDYAGSKVLVKWANADTREILLLRLHRRAGDGDGFVWVKPARLWTPGRYAVRIYSGDEKMDLLTEGTYVVE